MRMSISPKFSVKEIVDSTIGKDWIKFQAGAFDMGKRLHAYMINFLNSHKHRRGGNGKLAKSINFEVKAGAGLGTIFWGLGNISSLPKYYYWANFGGQIPAGGGFVPGSFEGSRPESGLRGGVEKFNYKDGSGFGMKPGTVARGIHYIEATRTRLNASLRALLLRLKSGVK